ncbi:MAG: hypothetical protein ACLUH9_04980 [Waltera sp.]
MDIEQFPKLPAGIAGFETETSQLDLCTTEYRTDFQTAVNNELQGGKVWSIRVTGIIARKDSTAPTGISLPKCIEIIHGPQKFPAGECYFPV